MLNSAFLLLLVTTCVFLIKARIFVAIPWRTNGANWMKSHTIVLEKRLFLEKNLKLSVQEFQFQGPTWSLDSYSTVAAVWTFKHLYQHT